ncbi:uncharacterized protein LOC128221454 [Mya arenaria]|uniref:uncharacterized protein LOC128221454 n=1 Tax=Mya arenaria TaxID=6604 RepID=UPI0022E16D3F|nr:uncharacterized protein LOC128221454 [Mya arenaria]
MVVLVKVKVVVVVVVLGGGGGCGSGGGSDSGSSSGSSSSCSSSSRRTIEIHSTKPIWAAIVTTANNELEAFLLLPVNALSTEYFIPSYRPYSANSYMSQFLIVATETDTTVAIEFPSTFTPWAKGHIQIELQKYQTYLFQNLMDTTGTLVTSDKAISVFAGNNYGTVPKDGSGLGYMVEQVLPTRFYDFKFIVPAMIPRNDYYIRIFSVYDDTEVNMYNSTTHDSHFLKRLETFKGHFMAEPTLLLADKPIYVMIYSTNHFMMTAQALSQFQSEYEFTLQSYTSANIIAVTIKTADVSELYLDGNKLAINNTKTIQVASPLQDYSVLYISITGATIHRIHHSRQRKFGAVLYESGNSYAYGMPLQMTLTDIGCYLTNGTNSTLAPGQGSHLGSQINYQASGKDVNCFNCEDMTHLKYCDRVTTCRENEVCYVQSYSKSLNTVRYKSGCTSKLNCRSHGSSGCFECCDGSYCNFHGCSDNGLVGISQRGPFCFECRHIRAGEVCETVQLCSVTETVIVSTLMTMRMVVNYSVRCTNEWCATFRFVKEESNDIFQACMVEEYKWGENDRHYIQGCTDAQLCSSTRKRAVAELDRDWRNVPGCSHCCTTDFCNSNCTASSISPGIIG